MFKNIVLGALFILGIAAGGYLLIDSAKSAPSQPCDDVADQNCTWKRSYGAQDDK